MRGNTTIHAQICAYLYLHPLRIKCVRPLIPSLAVETLVGTILFHSPLIPPPCIIKIPPEIIVFSSYSINLVKQTDAEHIYIL